MAPRETTVIGVAMAPDEAIVRAGQALEHIRARSIAMVSPTTVQGSIGASFTSWGETIHLDVAPAPHGSWITIDSRSSFVLTLFDWGKNAQNIRALAGLLDSWDAQLHPRPA